MKPSPIPAESLAGLHDVVTQEAVSLFPATPAWLVVFALPAAALVWMAVRSLRSWQRNRYRREATRELRALEARLATSATRLSALAEISALVKRVALHVAPRDEVASLSGAPWLEFLDRTWTGAAFGTGPGRLLSEIAYTTPARFSAISPAEIDALVALVREWIPAHRAPSESVRRAA
jgi:hypothetical protein